MQERKAILELQTKAMPLSEGVNLRFLASAAVGYSGADLAALCREAAMLAITDESLAAEVSMP